MGTSALVEENDLNKQTMTSECFKVVMLCSFNIFGSLLKINIVFPTSVWSEASEKSEYLMNFRHIFVYVIFRSKRKYK